MTLRVPGKAFLFGEYAVLLGAPAAVMAVRRHVLLRPAPQGTAMAPLVAAGRQRTLRSLGSTGEPTPWMADSSALEDARGKMGLGSSAAVAAGAVASVFAEAGLDLRDGSLRRRVLALAREVHDMHQAQPGSGADVAASIYGGRILYRRNDTEPRAWIPPPGLVLRFARTLRSVSTADRIEALHRARADRPERVQGPLARLADLAENLAEDAGDLSRFLRLVDAFTDALIDLGDALDRPMLPGPERSLRSSVRRLGGVLKPSGAGGGDLLVAFLPESVPTGPWQDLVREAGLEPLDLAVDMDGLTLEGA